MSVLIKYTPLYLCKQGISTFEDSFLFNYQHRKHQGHYIVTSSAEHICAHAQMSGWQNISSSCNLSTVWLIKLTGLLYMKHCEFHGLHTVF
jgi:hypothetical protein